MPSMSNIRKEDLSLYYYIKDYVLSNFIEFDEKATLNFVEALSSTNNDSNSTTNSYVYDILFNVFPIPSQRGRGLVYFDSVDTDEYCYPYVVVSGTRVDGVSVLGTPEQSNRVIVYDEFLNVIDSSEYMIDYVDCRVVTSGSCQPAYIDYYWNYISVVDEWELLSYIDPPVVVVDVKPYNKAGYQLGGGQFVKRLVDLHVFASSAAERNDMVDILYDGLYNKKCPVYDFSTGSILDYDGTWYGRKDNPNKLTSLFDRGVVSGTVGNSWFEDINVKYIESFKNEERNIQFLDKSNKYRAKISFYMNYYTTY